MLDLHAVAERAGISYTTVRNYHAAASRRRRDGEPPRPGDLPAPDQYVGRSPAWTKTTIDRWLANRPGQGKGGGRPAWKRETR